MVAFKPHENYDWGWATLTDPESRRYVHRDLYITPGTEIQVKVKAYNTKGEGPYSQSSVVYAPQGGKAHDPTVQSLCGGLILCVCVTLAMDRILFAFVSHSERSNMPPL